MAAETPKASPSTHAATRDLANAGTDPLFLTKEKGGANWNPGGSIAFPTDPAAAAELDRTLGKLAREFSSHIKVPGKVVDGEFEPEPLRLREKVLRDGVKLHPDHLPGPMNAQMKGHVTNWKEQRATRCAEPGCYYPLKVKTLERNNHDPIKFPAEGGGEVIAGECSWEPRHAGGLQFIPVRKPGDEG
jgi:hypothetical protein